MSLLALQVISFVGVVILAGLIFFPYFSAENCAKRRKAFVESVADKMRGWNKRFISNTDLVTGLVGVTLDWAYNKEWEKCSVAPVVVWPTFVFGRPGRPRRIGQTGTTDDLLELYGIIIEDVTKYKRSKFKDHEIWYIASKFVLNGPHLFIPGAGTPEENNGYIRRNGQLTLKDARLFISTNSLPLFVLDPVIVDE